MRKFTSKLVFLAATAVAAISPQASDLTRDTDRPGLVVHEWGTFTSVAGVDGAAVAWMPVEGATDLPCFVHRAGLEGKAWFGATVRMETPVLYFYSPRETTVDVQIGFREGVITEWYPRADVTPVEIKEAMLKQPDLESSIAWSGVKVLPNAPEQFLQEESSNHYYAARATHAAPIQVGAEREKFLFYRGIANFAPPLSAVVASNGNVEVSAASGQRVGDIMLFQNRAGRSAHQVKRGQPSTVGLEQFLPRGWTTASAREDLEQLLVSHGLYEQEARAMLETWKDSWFEEGARLFYVVPASFVDSVLPLDIVPAPASVARVFVGRMELLTSATLHEVRTALATRDRDTLRKHQRFLKPILARIHAGASAASRDEDLRFAAESVYPRASACLERR